MAPSVLTPQNGRNDGSTGWISHARGQILGTPEGAAPQNQLQRLQCSSSLSVNLPWAFLHRAGGAGGAGRLSLCCWIRRLKYARLALLRADSRGKAWRHVLEASLGDVHHGRSLRNTSHGRLVVQARPLCQPLCRLENSGFRTDRCCPENNMHWVDTSMYPSIP